MIIKRELKTMRLCSIEQQQQQQYHEMSIILQSPKVNKYIFIRIP